MKLSMLALHTASIATAIPDGEGLPIPPASKPRKPQPRRSGAIKAKRRSKHR